jgi:hypothetical protein
MKNTNQNSTKDELVTASMEYISWIETNTFTKKQTLVIGSLLFLLGWICG